MLKMVTVINIFDDNGNQMTYSHLDMEIAILQPMYREMLHIDDHDHSLILKTDIS